jgi:putative hydrolase of the HAD superfamily
LALRLTRTVSNNKIRVDMIKVVFFDFGGVLAEEGFRNGIDAVGARQGIEGLFAVAERLIYDSGYVLGLAEERQFWDDLRRETGLEGTDMELRKEVLDRFTLRPEVLDEVREIKGKGIQTAMLSDQTNWLDELDRRSPFYLHFDRVFNSYRMHKGKRDPSVFTDVCRELGIAPGEGLLVDDNPGNVERAKDVGMQTILYRDLEQFRAELREKLEKNSV